MGGKERPIWGGSMCPRWTRWHQPREELREMQLKDHNGKEFEQSKEWEEGNELRTSWN